MIANEFSIYKTGNDWFWIFDLNFRSVLCICILNRGIPCNLFFLPFSVLSSDVIFTSDEESTGGEGSDSEDLGKDLESMLSNKKISNEVYKKN